MRRNLETHPRSDPRTDAARAPAIGARRTKRVPPHRNRARNLAGHMPATAPRRDLKTRFACGFAAGVDANARLAQLVLKACRQVL
jgi:hypothetical protein